MSQGIEIWTTREGTKLDINKMTSSHLLSAIHLVERRRLENLMQLALQQTAIHEGMMDYYSSFPAQYDALIKEAQRRGLIKRCETSLAKRKK